MFCSNTVYTENIKQLENPPVKNFYCLLPFFFMVGVPSHLFSDLARNFNQGGLSLKAFLSPLWSSLLEILQFHLANSWFFCCLLLVLKAVWEVWFPFVPLDVVNCRQKKEEVMWELTFSAISRYESTAPPGSCSHKWCCLDKLNDGMLKFHMKQNDFHICRSSSVALVMLIKWCYFSGSAWGSCQAVTEDSIWGNNSASKIQMADNLLGFLLLIQSCAWALLLSV